MTKYNVSELPKIVHHLQVIVLACDIQAMHKGLLRQELSPNIAREMAMAWCVKPNNAREALMVQDAYRTAIHVWKAFDALGISWSEGRRLSADQLIMAGLT